MSNTERDHGLLDEMLRERLEGRGETDTDADAIRQILALVAGLPDDAPMIVNADRDTVDARTVREWASFYSTPGTVQ
jgi:hypothetical protein